MTTTRPARKARAAVGPFRANSQNDAANRRSQNEDARRNSAGVLQPLDVAERVLADGDLQGLAKREVLLAHGEHEEFLHLLLGREITRKLRFGSDDLLRDFEVGAEK